MPWTGAIGVSENPVHRKLSFREDNFSATRAHFSGIRGKFPVVLHGSFVYAQEAKRGGSPPGWVAGGAYVRAAGSQGSLRGLQVGRSFDLLTPVHPQGGFSQKPPSLLKNRPKCALSSERYSEELTGTLRAARGQQKAVAPKSPGS
jgi:hypothetical protein